MHIRERGISMANAHLRLVTPTGEIPTITPRRGKNAEYRTREHLTESEVERLIEATTSHRDATMVLIAYRHGLRASELVDLRWDQVDFELGVLHVRRAKAGTPATHPLTGRELHALRRLQRETADFLRAPERATALATLIHQRRLTPSCGGHAPTAERTVGPARMIVESLTPRSGIRELVGPNLEVR